MIAFSSPLNIMNGSILTTTVYEKIVRDQLIDAVTTNFGERVMHPTWGCNIEGMLFDPANEVERADTAAYIRDQLVHMVPRAVIQGVFIGVSDVSPSTVYIRINYKTSNYMPAQTVSVAVDVATTAGSTAGANA